MGFEFSQWFSTAITLDQITLDCLDQKIAYLFFYLDSTLSYAKKFAFVAIK